MIGPRNVTTRFELADVVRIQRLRALHRDVDGPTGDPPQPRVGDQGVVVAEVGDDLYLVEHRTDDGQSVWMAEFHADELALLERGEG